MTDSSFSLVPIWQIIWDWKRQIIVFVTGITVAVAVAVFFLPKYYLSAAVAVPGNPLLSDKSKLFNNNIQGLYSPYGSSDELERLAGIAGLDTVFNTIISEFGLIKYYDLPANDSAKSAYKALKALKQDLRIQQTDKGQLKIMMWHKDRNQAAAIVNRAAGITRQISMNMQSQFNQQSLTSMDAAIKMLEEQLKQNPADAVAAGQLLQYKKIAGEVQVAISNNPASLIILERGYAAGKEDKPKKLSIVATTFFLSLLFAVLTALLYHRKNKDAAAL